MDYYQKKLYIPQVTEADEIIGKVERWDAHTNGILHRGFTVGVYTEEGDMLMQHRKHPVFDHYYDLTASSHQVYEGDVLQDVNDAIYKTLEREWNIPRNLLATEPKYIGSSVYKSDDGTYVEHEVCHVYTLNLGGPVTSSNPEYAYGFMAKPLSEIVDADYPDSNGLAPWVTSFFEQGVL